MGTKIPTIEMREADANAPLLHARQFPADPKFDEHGELCGGAPHDWEALQEALGELLKLARSTDQIGMRFRTTEDHKDGEIEIGIEAGN